MGLIDELKRRNVFRVGIAYAVLAWVVIQVTDTVAPALGMPDWTLTVVTWFGVIAFPFALLLAWAFELTPQGIKPEYKVDRSESITHETGRKINFIIIGLLAVALGFVVWDAYLRGPANEIPMSEPPNEGVASEASPSALSSSEMKGSVARLPTSSPRWRASVAVLPFVNMSGDPDNEYFSDGVSEELLHALSSLKGLKVPARTSSFFFKGKNEDIKLIGKTLGVEHVLEGSVRKAGERVRITAQLVQVSDGAHLWSETYDRELRDIFAVQDEIATNIAQHLQVELGLDSLNASVMLGTQNVVAYEHYLRAIQLTASFPSSADLQLGIVNLQQAIELDPDFAAAYAHLGQLHFFSVARGLSQSFDKAVVAYNRALELDPNQAVALIVKARVELQSGWDWANVERLLRQAMAHGQSPAYSQAMLATVLLMPTGQMDEAEQLLRNAMELDPLQPEAQNLFGLFLLTKNDFAAVLEYLTELVGTQRSPEIIATECYANFGLGDKDEVRRMLQELRDFKPPVPQQIAGCEVHWYLLNGDHPAAMAAYQRREALIGTSGHNAVVLGNQALRLGNIERAIDWFELAMRAQRPRIVWVRTQHRDNAELNTHPRYQALLRKMNLDDESLRRMGYLK